MPNKKENEKLKYENYISQQKFQPLTEYVNMILPKFLVFRCDFYVIELLVCFCQMHLIS